MKKSKLLMAIVFALFSLVSIFALTACSHTHDFKQEIQSPEYLASEYDCVKNVKYYKSCACGESSQGKPEEATFIGTSAAHRTLKEIVDEKYLVVEASCTENGIYYKSCADCGEAVEEIFRTPELPHDYKSVAVIDTTKDYCDGHDWITICTICHTQKTDAESIRFEEAHCDEWHVGKEPTTTEEGYITGICNECNQMARKQLKKLERNSSFYKVEVLDACDEEGLIRYTYTFSGQDFVFEDRNCEKRHLIGKKDIFESEFNIRNVVLNFDDYEGIILNGGKEKPTCDTNGEIASFYCSRCDSYYGVKVRVDHKTPDNYVIEKATCETIYISFDCLDCNTKHVTKELPGAGHKTKYVLSPENAAHTKFKLECVCYNMLVDEDHPEPGYECGNINNAESVYNIALSSMDITPATCQSGTIYRFTHKDIVYTYNDEVKEESHLYKNGDFSNRLVVGNLYHISECKGIEVVGGQDDIPVCGEIGREAVFSCEECGFSYKVNVRLDHSKPLDYVLPEADCVNVVESHYHCKGCGIDQVEYVSAVGHSYSYEITVAPTRTTTGKAVITCSHCNEEKEIELPVIPEKSNADYTIKANLHESCISIGRYVCTYHYTYKIQVYDKSTDSVKSAEKTIDMTFNHVEGTSEHINSSEDGSLKIIVINGVKYKGYICSKCGRFIIVE